MFQFSSTCRYKFTLQVKWLPHTYNVQIAGCVYCEFLYRFIYFLSSHSDSMKVSSSSQISQIARACSLPNHIQCCFLLEMLEVTKEYIHVSMGGTFLQYKCYNYTLSSSTQYKVH